MHYKHGDVVIITYGDKEGLYKKDVIAEVQDFKLSFSDNDYIVICIMQGCIQDEMFCPVNFLRKATKKEQFIYRLYGSNALIKNENKANY